MKKTKQQERAVQVGKLRQKEERLVISERFIMRVEL